MKEKKTELNGTLNIMYMVQRILTVLVVGLIFFPFFNPARICKMISDKISIFTSAISYGTLTGDASRALTQGWVDETVFVILFVGALVALIGIIGTGVGACMSLGNIRFKRLGALISLLGGVVELVGYILCFVTYQMLNSGSMTPTQYASKLEKKIQPIFPAGVVIYGIVAVVIIVLSIAIFFMLPKASKEEPYEMDSKYKLFLMFLPFGFFISYYLKAEKLKLPIILTLIASVAVEFVQMCIGRVFDVDDILLNLLGGTIGFYIYNLLTKIGNKFPKVFHNEWVLNIGAILVLVGLFIMLI